MAYTEAEWTHNQQIEFRIMTACVEEFIAQGFTLDVFDGEETTVNRSSDAAVVLAALRTVDDDNIIVYDPKRTGSQRIGFVYFVYGNEGCHVIADYSSNLEALMPLTMAAIEAAEKEQGFA